MKVVRRLAAMAACALLLAACGSSAKPVASDSPASSPTASFSPRSLPLSGYPPCEVPSAIPTPTWFPSDLPLPEGSFTSEVLPDTGAYHRAAFVIPLGLEDAVRFILTEWPARGWTLGEGEAEEGEAEDQFYKGESAGAFRANQEYCMPGFVTLTITYAAARPSASP